MQVHALRKYLEGYDINEVTFLMDGFSRGFSVYCEKVAVNQNCNNLRSTVEHKDIVFEKICKELLAHRFAGPFLMPPFTNFNISPLGLCPKKEPNKFRLIHHLSYPAGDSVNDFISKEFTSVRYTQISDAIAGIMKLERCSHLCKTDISNAYRNLPLKPEDYHLFGFKWNDLYYYDKCLPMGCASSCQIFERFSSSLHWVGQSYMPKGMIFHILDDFLIVAQSAATCANYLHKFLSVCSEIGIPMAPEKTVGPVTCLTFLGIELDTVKQEARLPKDKLEKCLGIICDFLKRKKVTLQELQSLCGLLNFACSVIVAGKAFLRRLFELTRGLRKPHHRVKLTRGCKDDLIVWKTFLENFNGKCFFLDDRLISADMLQLYTDASGGYGYGAVFKHHWFYGQWDENWFHNNITVKELYPIVLSVELWGHEMSNRSLCFNCDNDALVHVLNKHTSTEPNVMFLVRKLVLLALKFNIVCKAQHLPGKSNILSDALSRLQISKFKSLMPNADPIPAEVPHLPSLPT